MEEGLGLAAATSLRGASFSRAWLEQRRGEVVRAPVLLALLGAAARRHTHHPRLSAAAASCGPCPNQCGRLACSGCGPASCLRLRDLGRRLRVAPRLRAAADDDAAAATAAAAAKAPGVLDQPHNNVCWSHDS